MTLNALLEEPGCNKSEIDEFILMGEENRYDAQQRLLRKKTAAVAGRNTYKRKKDRQHRLFA